MSEIDLELMEFTWKFVCPKCGGTYFGTSTEDNVRTRHCHGSASWGGCGYSWDTKDDDRHAYLSYLSVKPYLTRPAPNS